METKADGFDGLLGVDGSCTGDYDGLKSIFDLLSEHLVEIEVQSDAMEMFFGPCQLSRLRRASSHKVSSWGKLVEMAGMSGTHATEACNGDV